MREKSLFATAVFAVFCTGYIESVPFITKCKSDDAKCAKASAQVAIPIFALGLPEFGVKPLDPVTFHNVDASSPNLKFILTDVTFKGLKDCLAKKIKRDKAKSKLFLKFQCSGFFDGLYEMKGQLLFLPIEGKGPLHVKLRKLEISLDIDLEENNGKWNMKQWKHSFELKDNSEVVFENLFNGNEVLSKAAQEVIANSGNDIILEIGQPVIDVMVDTVLKEVNAFFHHVPASDLSID